MIPTLSNLKKKFGPLAATAALTCIGGAAVAADAPSPPPQILSLVRYDGFPEGWKIRGKEEDALRMYGVTEAGGETILSARVEGKPIRIFKKVAWNPHEYPTLTWRWRAVRFPEGRDSSIDVYVSLNRDVMGIPTFIKYIWSGHLPVGTEKKGGFFGAAQIVVQSGPGNPGEWVTERIRPLDDYRRLYDEDPGEEAYGIGFLIASGLEVEISEITALPEGADEAAPE